MICELCINKNLIFRKKRANSLILRHLQMLKPLQLNAPEARFSARCPALKLSQPAPGSLLLAAFSLSVLLS